MRTCYPFQLARRKAFEAPDQLNTNVVFTDGSSRPNLIIDERTASVLLLTFGDVLEDVHVPHFSRALCINITSDFSSSLMNTILLRLAAMPAPCLSSRTINIAENTILYSIPPFFGSRVDTNLPFLESPENPCL